MAKPKPTRTYNPIHFEDLEPKRFEDLVRELIYDFRDWQSIEATGRGGDDDGFDVRAYEKLGETVLDEDGVETVHPMEGNLWMIQGKREKQIGPTKLKKLLEEVDEKNPPYGYILAASANFSKTSFDTFRTELRNKGVMEFYLWGKPELEGQLHLPKNDRILFTFFGISNVSRKRSRATEIRFSVTNKNRLYRIFGDNPEHSRVLVRDSKDSKYPYSNEYKDFDERPRWKEYQVVDYHPLGLVVEVSHYYAYYDHQKQKYDIADGSSLIFREGDTERQKDKQRKNTGLVRDYWENLPRRTQAKFHKNGLIRYDSIFVVDDKGDNWNDCPHLFVDFVGTNGPFWGFLNYLMVGRRQVLLDDLISIKKFPKKFPQPTFGKIHKDQPLQIPDMFAERFLNYRDSFNTLYDCNGRFNHLAEGDVAVVKKEGKDDGFIQVTHRYQTTVRKLLEDQPHLSGEIEQQIGREPKKSEIIEVIEFRRTNEFQFEPRK